MKIKDYILLTALWIIAQFSATLSAQPRVISEPKVIIESEGQHFQNPVWSPDGSSFAFTSAQYQGIWVADKTGKNIRRITGKNAGFDFAWSADSKSLLTRVTKYVNRRQQSAIVLFDKETGAENQLTEYRGKRNAALQWDRFEEKVILLMGNKIEVIEGSPSGSVRSDETARAKNAAEIARGNYPENQPRKDITPFDDATYLNLQISPDGTKVAFEVYGGHLFVMNIDGSGLQDLGKASRPQWSPDSEYVLANKTEDDGHNITRADILALSIDGKEEVNLTADTPLIAMNPSWGPDDDFILFDNPETGNIYMIEISR